jgi:hypothetical protein
MAIGVSDRERSDVIRRILRKPGLVFMPARVASSRISRRRLFSAAAVTVKRGDSRRSRDARSHVWRRWRTIRAVVELTISCPMAGSGLSKSSVGD